MKRQKISFLSYLASALVLITSISIVTDLSVPHADASSPKFETYMDAPFVQASYVTGSGSITETFDSLTAAASGTQCDGNTWSIGTVSNPTAGVDCRVFPNSDDLGAMTSNSDPRVNESATAGVGSKFVTTNPGNGYSVSFSGPQKYIGFWWSAGSAGNRVNFKSNGQIVAYMDVGTISAPASLMGKFGSAPTCTSSATYLSKTDSVTALDGNTYPTRRYFGTPVGYTSLAPTSCSTRVANQPYVYIHAFATNGATFDSVEFSGANFEIDNVTVSNVAQSPLTRLVLLEKTNANALNFSVTYDQRGGTGATGGSDTFTVGTAFTLKSAPTKAGYTFNGWYTQAVGGTLAGNAGASYDPGATSNITLYARWGAATNTSISLNSADLSPGGSFVQGATQRIQATVQDAVDNSLLPSTAGVIDFAYVDGLGTARAIPNCTGVALSIGVANCNFVIPSGVSPYVIYATFQTSDAMAYSASANNTGTKPVAHTARFLSNSGYFSDSSTVQSNPYVEIGTAIGAVKPTSPNRLYYNFLGWTKDNSTILPDTYTVDASETFTAMWQVKIMAVFDAYGGYFSDSSTVQFSAEFAADTRLISSIKPTDPSKNFYTFMGWSSDGANVFSDHLLHSLEFIKAVFVPNFTYTNSFYSNGGTFSDSSTVQTSILHEPHIFLSSVYPLDPTNGRKIFMGWSADSATVVADQEITGSNNYWALWGADGVYATFLSDGGVFSDLTTIQVSSLRAPSFDAMTITPSSPTRSGYTFGGWKVQGNSSNNPLSTFAMATDTTFVPIWSQITSGGSGNSQPSDPGPDIRVPGIAWEPSNLIEGEAIGVDQLNAQFSVPGKVEYSLTPGTTPPAGSLAITVTFTPENRVNYLVVSTTKIIQVLVRAKPTPAPSESASPIPVSEPVISVKPKTLMISQLKKLGVIYFNSNEYFLDAGDRSTLNEISIKLRLHNYSVVVIHGNTDLKLGVDNNWLSKARAESVSKFLFNADKNPQYIRAWFAARRPAAIGLDAKSLALNRRVEIYAQISVAKEEVSEPLSEKPRNDDMLGEISFRPHESFLDAYDRKSLVNSAKKIASIGCTRILLRASSWKNKSADAQTISAARVRQIRKFIAILLPSMQYTITEFNSPVRTVQIYCAN